jgi:hypothetical protein
MTHRADENELIDAAVAERTFKVGRAKRIWKVLLNDRLAVGGGHDLMMFGTTCTGDEKRRIRLYSKMLNMKQGGIGASKCIEGRARVSRRGVHAGQFHSAAWKVIVLYVNED